MGGGSVDSVERQGGLGSFGMRCVETLAGYSLIWSRFVPLGMFGTHRALPCSILLEPTWIFRLMRPGNCTGFEPECS